MRVEFSAADRRPRFRRVIVALAAAGTLVGCAPGPAAHWTSVATGEIALAPTAATPAVTTATPVTLAELEEPAPVVRSVALAAPYSSAVRSGAPLVVPALAPRPTAAARGDVEVWRGTYDARTYGRRGALALVLRPTPAGVRGTVAWRVAAGPAAAFRHAGDSVALVRVPVVAVSRDSGQLVLQLDAYFDPACDCTARATFHGMVRGDTLVGRFAIDGPPTVVSEHRGRWRAVRVAP